MAVGYNSVTLIGNLGDDPQCTTVNSGSMVANFTLAINEYRKNAQTGENSTQTEWVRVAAWGKTAEIVQKYLRKGSQVHVTGKLRTHTYDDKNTGEKKYSTQIVCDSLLMLGSASSNKQNNAHQQQGNQQFGTPEINSYVNNNSAQFVAPQQQFNNNYAQNNFAQQQQGGLHDDIPF